MRESYHDNVISLAWTESHHRAVQRLARNRAKIAVNKEAVPFGVELVAVVRGARWTDGEKAYGGQFDGS